MDQYFKAVRPDGTDFRTGTVDYLAGGTISHPSSTGMVRNDASTYLSISVEPAETLIGGRWPCRLLRVQPVAEVMGDLSTSPYKRACLALDVVEELPAWRALGPNGEHVAAALIKSASEITSKQASGLVAARAAARDAAWAAAGDAAGAAAWAAARAAARDAAWAAAGDAAGATARAAAGDAAGAAAWAAARAAAWALRALVVRDLISSEHYRALTEPWVSVMGAIHPEDEGWAA